MNGLRLPLTLALTALLSLPLVAHEPRDYLEEDDVHGVMGKILRQHIEVRAVTPEIVSRSLKSYIDQVDPDRSLFLSSEVSRFLEPTDSDLQSYVEAYKRDDFSIYWDLNALTQKAIRRSRVWREAIAADIDNMVAWSSEDGALRRGLPEDIGEEPKFVDTENDLYQRLVDDVVRFLAAQRLRAGDTIFERYQHRAMHLYETRRRSVEHEYLFESELGERMNDADQEHYFVLHVLKAITASLDAHTSMFDSAEAYDMRVRLEKGFHGIGVVLQESIQGVIITKLIPGGPAEKSGLIQPDDHLVEVDGRSIVDDSFRAVLDLIRGDRGSVVTLGLNRQVEGPDGELAEQLVRVEITRDKVTVSESRVDVEHREVDGGIIGIIKLHSFYEGEDGVSSEEDVRKALSDLHKLGRLRGVVLDLRDNTGGFLVQAVKVAGLFITNGVVVVSQYSGGYTRIFRDIDGYTYYNGPLVVLTSKASASAAEIVAQALQDYGSAIVVGDNQTYGKGSIQHQTVTDESSTSFFKVTVGRFYTVSGRSTQIRGVRSDIVVPSVFHKEEIGEQYLDYALSTDTIEPFYTDGLTDVDHSVRYWYKKYYLPSLQKPSERWTDLLPELRKRSEERLADNVDYQEFLNRDGDDYQKALLQASENLDEDKPADIQLEETVNILEDMVQLRLQTTQLRE